MENHNASPKGRATKYRTNGVALASPRERSAKQRESGVALAPSSHASEESSFNVERSETNERKPKTVGRNARKARKNATIEGERGHNRLDESSECDDEPEIQVGAYGIAGPQLVNHLIDEDQPPVLDGPNVVDNDVNSGATLVEADLAPEVTLAEEVNIQREEKLILKKGQYKRVLFFAMILTGLSIIFCIASFGYLFVNGPHGTQFEFAEGSTQLPMSFWHGVIAAILQWIVLFVLEIPTRACSFRGYPLRYSIRTGSWHRGTSTIPLEDYAPDDKQLLHGAQIASYVSMFFSNAGIMTIWLAPADFQWLGYASMTWFFAATVFASSRVHLLRRPSETRQKIPLFVWFLSVLFFLGLTGITIWVCYNPKNPDCTDGYDGGDCDNGIECTVEDPSRIGDDNCDGGTYNTMECDYDGGDCVFVNGNYPNCTVPDFNRIGDGNCNGRVYGTVECGFDGGDCLQNGERCHGDGDCASEFCNAVTKVCDSYFDPKCSVENPEWIGDGECDGGDYASEACGFDGGDCEELGKPCSQDEECASGFCNADTKVCYLGVLENYPDCIVDFPRKIGDGECDGGEYATEECGYDGGDC